MTAVRRYEASMYDSTRWDGFELRPGDIIISTPPKCGTTWTQMICALLILQEPELPLPLDTLSPWIDMVTRARTDVFADLEAQMHRRFIKTHTPLDGIPNDPTVTYICVGRDPRDVGLSMGRHIDNTDIGLLVATSSFVGAVAALPFGTLADRVRRTWTLAGAIVCWGAARIWSATVSAPTCPTWSRSSASSTGELATRRDWPSSTSCPTSCRSIEPCRPSS